MDTDKINHAGARIAKGRRDRVVHTPLPAAFRPGTVPQGYAVQAASHEALAKYGLGTVVAHKIGCTTPTMQDYMGIDHPCAGGVFDKQIHESPTELALSDYVRIGVECEIAIRLSRDLPPIGRPHDRATVAEAVGACMAAIELVDDRFDDLIAAGAPMVIADDFCNAGCVLGPPVSNWKSLDLEAIIGTTTIDGVETGRGVGADVMGHPFEALAWLANLKAQQGAPLKAGEFVLTGAIAPVHWMEGPGQAVISIGALGEVRARFS